MNLPPFSIGALMIVLGVMPHFFASQQGASPSPFGWVLAVALVAGGVSLLLRRGFSAAVALAAGLLTAGAGVAGLVANPDRAVGLPMPPVFTLVAGLYICLRVAMARSVLGPPRERLRASDLAADQKEGSDPPT